MVNHKIEYCKIEMYITQKIENSFFRCSACKVLLLLLLLFNFWWNTLNKYVYAFRMIFLGEIQLQNLLTFFSNKRRE